MTDATDATAPAPAAVPTSTTPAPVKPGYKTTEFWLKVAAILLTALYASGTLTNSTALAIAGIAATMLGSLGYAVSRSLVKAGGFAFLVVALAAPQTACTWFQHQGKLTEKAAIDCTVGTARDAVKQFGPVLDALLAQATTPDGKVNWDPVKELTKGFGAELGGCVLAHVVAQDLAPAPDNPDAPKSASLVLDPVSLRAGFDAIRAAQLGGNTFRTAHGTI